MANKYIIHGAAFNGDGTASNEAASAGAPGAWNNINILTGTAPANGTLDAGDDVYIRSKTSAGADITITLGAAANVGSTKATAGAWIRWILDNGAVWSGVDGNLKITFSVGTYTPVFKNYNEFISRRQDAFAVECTLATPSNTNIATFEDAISRNMLFVGTGTGGVSGCRLNFTANADAVLYNPHVKLARSGAGVFISGSNVPRVLIYNPDIELLSTVVSPMFSFATIAGGCRVFGGRVRGAGATSGLSIAATSGTSQRPTYVFTGLQFPKTVALGNGYGSPSASFFGLDGGIGAAAVEQWGEMDNRDDGNYPYLNAALPTSDNAGWSWKVYPANADRAWPVAVHLSKMMTGAAATKTLTLEMLIADTMSVDTANTWLEGYYIDDTTGETVPFTTRDLVGAALTTSTAAWSVDFYGAISCLKRKIAFTTPTAVKQDTAIVVTLMSTVKSASANDIFFVCPDPVLS